MLESSKKIGKYEDPLLLRLEKFLTAQGYDVLIHMRLNVAWSNVISDVDVLAISPNERIIIEVKSSHDNFYKAFRQLSQLKGFADCFYIATNKPIDSINMEKWIDDSIGLIYIDEHSLNIIKPAKRIDLFPIKGAISQLNKKCLVNLARALGIPTSLSKDALEKRLIEKYPLADLKRVVEGIVLCENDCVSNCALVPFMVTSNFIGKK
jgi:hypothetical protein